MKYMKRNIVIICILSIISLFFPSKVYALYIEGSFQYEISNGSAIITYYSGEEQEVTIPWNFGDKKVVEIVDNAFVDAKIETLIIPENCRINEDAYWDINIEYVDAFDEVKRVKEKLEKDPRIKIVKPKAVVKNEQDEKETESNKKDSNNYMGYVLIGFFVIALVFIFRRYI